MNSNEQGRQKNRIESMLSGNACKTRIWLTQCVWEETSNTSGLDSLDVYERKPPTLQVWTHSMCMMCYQRGSSCQDPAGSWTTRRPPDDRKETQTAVVWSRLPFIRSGQSHFARHSERGKKTRQTEEEVGKQHQAWSSPSPRGQWRTAKMEKTGCEIICGAPKTFAVKG